MADVLKGSCMCNGIKFEYTGKPKRFSYCHCKMCQKFSGGAFGAFLNINKDDLRYTKGEALKKVYISSDWASRTFCSQCGSSLEYNYRETPDNIALSAGLFDDDPKIRATKHIFVKDKCPWYEITDELEQIQKY